MSVERFQTLDVNRFRNALAQLHETVGCGKGRIEITQPGCDDVCVLISKAELEGLERALQIYSESPGFEHLSKQIAEIVASVDGRNVPAEAAQR